LGAPTAERVLLSAMDQRPDLEQSHDLGPAASETT
jgi:hypothetical protein